MAHDDIDLFDDRESLKAISVEELQEQADDTGYLTPREFAKLIGRRPQQVYSWLRKGFITSEKCMCGRRVIHVENAKEALRQRAQQAGRYVDESFDPRYVKGPDT